MIDMQEKLIALADVPAFIPPKRNGERVGLGAIYRWCRSGIRGVILETLQIGATKYTSARALQEFFSKLSRSPQPANPVLQKRQRRRSDQADEAELISAGG